MPVQMVGNILAIDFPLNLIYNIFLNIFSEDLLKPLDDYLSSEPSLRSLVSVVRLKERGGLIVARQEGARKAKGQVIFFI